MDVHKGRTRTGRKRPALRTSDRWSNLVSSRHQTLSLWGPLSRRSHRATCPRGSQMANSAKPKWGSASPPRATPTPSQSQQGRAGPFCAVPRCVPRGRYQHDNRQCLSLAHGRAHGRLWNEFAKVEPPREGLRPGGSAHRQLLPDPCVSGSRLLGPGH